MKESRRASERRVVGLAGADADHTIDVGDEDLAVTDLAGLGGLDDRLDDLVDEVAAHRDFDAGLGHEVDDVLGPAVELGVAALAAEALDLGDRHAGDADLRERRADVVELEGLDDCGDQFHSSLPNIWTVCADGTRAGGTGGPALPPSIVHLPCHRRGADEPDEIHGVGAGPRPGLHHYGAVRTAGCPCMVRGPRRA